jgi:hypothetical protein
MEFMVVLALAGAHNPVTAAFWPHSTLTKRVIFAYKTCIERGLVARPETRH